MDDRTPIIIGVGEASERIDSPDYAALSPVELAAAAARAALEDAGAAEPLALHVDVMAAIRQFEASGPHASAPFGRSDNFPRSVAQRIGADPARAILEPVGGQGPQHLVNEFGYVDSHVAPSWARSTSALLQLIASGARVRGVGDEVSRHPSGWVRNRMQASQSWTGLLCQGCAWDARRPRTSEGPGPT